MSNVIKFPTKSWHKPKTNVMDFSDKTPQEILTEFLKSTTVVEESSELLADECVEVAHEFMHTLKDAAEDIGYNYGLKLDLDDSEDASYNDFRVILNMLVAAMFKRSGLTHPFANDLTNLHGKLESVLDLKNEQFEFDMELFDNIDLTTITYNPEGSWEDDLPTDKDEE